LTASPAAGDDGIVPGAAGELGFDVTYCGLSRVPLALSCVGVYCRDVLLRMAGACFNGELVDDICSTTHWPAGDCDVPGAGLSVVGDSAPGKLHVKGKKQCKKGKRASGTLAVVPDSPLPQARSSSGRSALCNAAVLALLVSFGLLSLLIYPADLGDGVEDDSAVASSRPCGSNAIQGDGLHEVVGRVGGFECHCEWHRMPEMSALCMVFWADCSGCDLAQGDWSTLYDECEVWCSRDGPDDVAVFP
jgi:hypothetical protein